jgi:biotin carboxylase
VGRLLLLMTTTTYKAGAFLAAAQRIGVEVVVGTDRPQVLGSLHPAGNLTLPFTAPEEAVRRAIAFARTTPIRAVIAADDDGAVLAARLAQALGLRHNPVHAVQAATDKRIARVALRAAGLPVPMFRSFEPGLDPEAMAAQVSYPCVVKPLHLSASRGVIRADDAAEFVRAVFRLRRILADPELGMAESASILVEDYIPGEEVAVEGLLEAGRFRGLAIFDKPDPLVGPFFQETIYVTPSRHPAAVQAAVVATTARALEAIGLRSGPVHAEVRFNPSGTWLLEAAPRTIGGLCARTLRFGEGDVSLEELVLRHALGLETHHLEREARAAGVLMIPIPRAGILRGVQGLDAARAVADVEEIHITVPRGQRVVPPPEGGRYLGFIFARAATPDAVEEALRTSHGRLGIEIEPETAAPLEVEPHAAGRAGVEAKEDRR